MEEHRGSFTSAHCGIAVLLSSLLLIFFFGCSPITVTTSGYTNQLNLGTGLDSIDLVLIGQTTSFTGVPARIYFRLESVDNIAGSAVTIAISKKLGSVYTADTTVTFPGNQEFCHVFVTSFTLSTTGSYRAVGIYPTGTIASVNFTIQ